MQPAHIRTEAHNTTLREQLNAERRAHTEAKRIIAGLAERIPPQIEAPSETLPRATATFTEMTAARPSDTGKGPRESSVSPREALQEPARCHAWWLVGPLVLLLIVSVALLAFSLSWRPIE